MMAPYSLPAAMAASASSTIGAGIRVWRAMSAPAAMNAANEEAVGAFIDERICLTEIPLIIESVMNAHTNQPARDIETILEADRTARLVALAEIEKRVKATV
jgi:1-deoxy-D-xylulose 5-phosphate reductoisomerase